MITPNKPHSKHDTPCTSAPSAALRGALFAFAGPHASHAPPQRPAASSRPVTSVASCPPVPTKGTTIPSRPATPIAQTNTNPVPTPSRSHQTAVRNAATLAAQRSAGGGEAGAEHKHHKLRLSVPLADRTEDSSDVPNLLPTTGTVQAATDYFQRLSTRDAQAHDGSSVTPQEEDLQQVVSQRIRPRPQLNINTTERPDAAILSVQGLPKEIQSPKPVRTSFAAAPLEAVVSLEVDYGRSCGETLVKPFDTPTSFDGVAERKPHMPPPRRGVQPSPLSGPQRPTTSYVSPDGQRRPLLRPPPTVTSFSGRPKSEDDLARVKSQSPVNGNLVDAATARRIESMANAMVAGHLASSRVSSRSGSPAKPANLSLPRQLTGSQHVLYPGHSSSIVVPPAKRTPSPRKTIRQTMRTPISAVDPNVELAEKHKRSHFHMRKHPNKHREGDRKRWRDEITDSERKRYDGLWAANRGLLVGPLTGEQRFANPAVSNLEQCVSSLVVRDIWMRSRLPSHVLEEIWELVDRHRVGRLTREAFVVGLWLIDQRLKGRKLPTEVSDSIWHSARGIYGLKIPKVKC